MVSNNECALDGLYFDNQLTVEKLSHIWIYLEASKNFYKFIENLMSNDRVFSKTHVAT